MSGADSRLSLARPGLAAAGLEGLIAADRFVDPEPMRTLAPLAAVRRAPDICAEQLDQLLFGEAFDALEIAGGWAFGQARRDGYVGLVEMAALGSPGPPPTHWVSALATFAHAEPAIRSPANGPISHGAVLATEEDSGAFLRAAGLGWVPKVHLRAIGEVESDFVAVAERHLGVPYLWGGRSSAGLDCSGLILQSLFACGRGCPRDSDQQALLGEDAAGEPRRRGDLVFWRGHVGVMVDGERLLHANAHAMAVAVEPLAAARARIAAAGGGELTAARRLPLVSTAEIRAS